jgi:hypothetical protein
MNNVAVIAVILSGISLLISLSALRFTRATKIAEMKREVVKRYHAVFDAVRIMRIHAMHEDSLDVTNLKIFWSHPDSRGMLPALLEAHEKLENIKRASGPEIVRIYGEDMPLLDSLAESTAEVARCYPELLKDPKLAGHKFAALSNMALSTTARTSGD